MGSKAEGRRQKVEGTAAAPTAGPWNATARGSYSFEVQGPFAGYHCYALATVHGENAENRREALANARVIAAARELLDAAEAVEALTDRDDSGSLTLAVLSDYSEAFAKLRAAIRKARGQD